MVGITSYSAKYAKTDVFAEEDGTSPRRKSSSGGGGFWRSLLKLIFFGSVCAVGYIGFKAYQTKQGSPWNSSRRYNTFG